MLGPPGSTQVSSSRRRNRVRACGSTRCAGAVADARRPRPRGQSRLPARPPHPRRQRRSRTAACKGSAWLGSAVTEELSAILESGDDEFVPAALQHRSRHAGHVRESLNGIARHGGQRTGEVEVSGHQRQSRSQSELLGRRITPYPAPVRQRLEDGMRGCLGQVELAHHIRESHALRGSRCRAIRRRRELVRSAPNLLRAPLTPFEQQPTVESSVREQYLEY